MRAGRERLSRAFLRNVPALVGVALFATTACGWARGRSFPNEITGVITWVNTNESLFTLETDEPAGVLGLSVGYGCKFKRGGATADARILRPGARVHVNYFSTVFTGKVAAEVELNPTPIVENGIIERVDATTRELSIQVDHSLRRLTLRWSARARFTKHGRNIAPTDLRENDPITVRYFSPAFGRKYAVKIEAVR